MRIDWTNGKALHLVLQESEVPEFIDVLRVQEDRYQKRREENVVKSSQLWDVKQQTFDAANAQNREMLMHLWQVVFPDVPFEAEKSGSQTERESLTSSQWAALGFQGKYPPTDFRAMGMLSLYNMLYLAETRSKYLQNVLTPGRLKAGREAGERDYPWATAAINVTALMAKLLNLTDGTLSQPSSSNLFSCFESD